MNHNRNLRKEVVEEGRCMVRVRYPSLGEWTTAAMCPACWNNRPRRKTLLRKMTQMGVKPVHSKDLLDGVYETGKNHSPRCPYKHR
ncbi:MAG: hypothetical protein IEMM0008_0143 [bacterium]|nr:MAG: hypothetical protein IEMM0008_0143 [bacterium]